MCRNTLRVEWNRLCKGYTRAMTNESLDPSVPAAVRAVQVSAAAAGLTDLGNYRQALVLLRDGPAVVGRFCLPVSGGSIDGGRLLECVRSLAMVLWSRRMALPDSPGASGPASVVVCTRDRTEDLKSCLPSLTPLLARGHEVIVVDNCPSDDSTERLVATFPGVRYVREPRAGEGAARNCGLLAASHPIVAFTDDDARADAGWLDALLEPFDDPSVAVTTGITLPIELETPAQIWFERSNGFSRGLERRILDSGAISPAAAGEAGASVNMAVRKSCLAEIGFFDEALGCGTPARCGTDQEFLYRTLARGFRIVYEPSALIWHRHRRDWRALRRTLYNYGVGLYAWWTRAVLVEGDFGVLALGFAWFVRYHAVNLAKAVLRRPGHMPLDLALAEVLGAMSAPFAYLRSARALCSSGAPRVTAAGTAAAVGSLS